MVNVEIEMEGQNFEAELAADFFSHFKGLRFRKSGKMLFEFHRTSRPRIDMMFVPKALYLYFIDEEKRVVDMKKAEPWTKNPRTWKLYRPGKPSKYLLESFRPLDLEEGDRLEFATS